VFASSRAALVDGALVVALAAVSIWHVWIREDVPGPLWLRIVLPLLLDVPLFFRRRAPLAVLAVVVAAVVLQALLGREAAQGLELLGPVAVAVYSCARYAARREAVAGLALLVLAGAVNDLRSTGISTTAQIWADAFWSLAQLAIWLAGRFVRARSEQRRLVLQAESLERQADAAAAGERARIARELHDIVSHNLTVVVTQAAGARAMADTGAGAAVSLERIEESGRQALVEMRRLLDVMRREDGEPQRAPQPGVANLPALVETVRASGLEVDLRVGAACSPLPPALDLSVYRIVQEALSNVLRHSGASRAGITVERTAAGISVRVVDDGRGAASVAAAGHGLVGMRERAAILGGTVDAATRADGSGFLVHAELPVAAL
jgi:signal transduction histidine kinase